MKKKRSISTLLLIGTLPALASLAAAADAPQILDNPYGICAHVSRAELKIAPQEFTAFHTADINWVRTDFDWSGIEKTEGDWDYSRLDELIIIARKDKINILPILDYSVPWADPAWRHLDKWGQYVRNTVSRYSGDLRVWEVWNEQNGRLWGDTPNAANYTKLLKYTYGEIKKIDPQLTVLYGGTSGVPLPFIENTLKEGAGDYFDVMNIHPYHWTSTPESMLSQIQDLRALMQRYGVGDKPIWITEVGWSTARRTLSVQKLTEVALEKAGIDPSATTLAVLGQPVDDMDLPIFKNIESIPFSKLKDLDVSRYPVLIPTTSERFRGRYIPELLDYVKRGGTLLFTAGLPLYYELIDDGQGGFREEQVSGRHMKRFHMGWEAWWTQSGVPRDAKWHKVAPGFEGINELPRSAGQRFFHDRNLAPGDAFIPIILAGTDTYEGATAALYTFNSDLKGNIIVFTESGMAESISEQKQAQMLPRTYLLAFSQGVARVFWYNFRANERSPYDREAHFGIAGKELEPKPAFRAYQTLTQMCPTGSTVPQLQRVDGVYLANWRRPDGVAVWALWTANDDTRATLHIEGSNVRAVDYMGEAQAVPQGAHTVTPGILYLVGAEAVSLR